MTADQTRAGRMPSPSPWIPVVYDFGINDSRHFWRSTAFRKRLERHSSARILLPHLRTPIGRNSPATPPENGNSRPLPTRGARSIRSPKTASNQSRAFLRIHTAATFSTLWIPRRSPSDRLPAHSSIARRLLAERRHRHERPRSPYTREANPARLYLTGRAQSSLAQNRLRLPITTYIKGGTVSSKKTSLTLTKEAPSADQLIKKGEAQSLANGEVGGRHARSRSWFPLDARGRSLQSPASLSPDSAENTAPSSKPIWVNPENEALEFSQPQSRTLFTTSYLTHGPTNEIPRDQSKTLFTTPARFIFRKGRSVGLRMIPYRTRSSFRLGGNASTSPRRAAAKNARLPALGSHRLGQVGGRSQPITPTTFPCNAFTPSVISTNSPISFSMAPSAKLLDRTSAAQNPDAAQHRHSRSRC